MTNQRRKRISEYQQYLLEQLADDEPHMAVGLCRYHGIKDEVKTTKRSLRRLEAWGMVKLWYAPHPITEITEEEWEAKQQAADDRSHRAGVRCRSIRPEGNLKQPVLWACRAK